MARFTAATASYPPFCTSNDTDEQPSSDKDTDEVSFGDENLIFDDILSDVSSSEYEDEDGRRDNFEDDQPLGDGAPSIYDQEIGGDELLPSPPKSAPAASAVDKDGCIRIGKLIKGSPFVRTAPYIRAKSAVTNVITKNLWTTDRKFVNEGCLKALKRSLTSSALNRYITGDHVDMVCDYTGLQLSWAGGPSARSFESLYNFAIADGSVVYHSPPNFGFTMASLNWLKRSHPILVLPLLGRFLRTHDEPMADFQARKAT